MVLRQDMYCNVPELCACLPDKCMSLCDTQYAGSRDKKRRVVLVMFIGGVTFAEIGALRFLSTRPEVRSDFVIATTKLMNGSSMLETFLEDVASEAMLSKQPSNVT